MPQRKTQQQIKQEQAQMQSDALEMDTWVPSSEGITMTGTVDSLDPGMGVSYSFGDMGQLDLFPEEDMREKYPALKQAYEHYQSVLEVCKTKEREDEN